MNDNLSQINGLNIIKSDHMPKTRERTFKFKFPWYKVLFLFKRYYYLTATIKIKPRLYITGNYVIVPSEYYDKLIVGINN